MRREGLVVALLMGMTAWTPLGVCAQESEKDDWITPDVAGSEEAPAEEEAPADEEPQSEEEAPAEGEPASEGDAPASVDEVVVEYGEAAEDDKVTDEKGAEIPDQPVVSKAVVVQDPDQLEPGADKETGVQGQVVSRKPKKVLPDAPVLAKGIQDKKLRSTITDDRGRYRLYLPPGNYTLRSYYDLYHGARWDNVAVTRGKFKRINFVLDPITEKDAGVEEQEVIYLADTSSEAAQLNIRKETVGVQDSISAEEIKRAGDSTAKSAVTRVVGVTIDDEDRIIVRGLAGRYNQILLNGVPVPGVDPDIPSVKLDIFPTDVVSNLSVVKVPRPDLPGAFAGGLLMIDTTAYPRDLQFKIGASFGVNSLSTFRQMPTYQGGRRDWLGYDDGTRGIPGAVGSERLDLSRPGSGDRYITRDQLNQVGRQFRNVWNPRTRTAVPKLNFKTSLRNSHDLKKEGRRAGYQLSFLYDYEDKIHTGFSKLFSYAEDGSVDETLSDFDIRAGVQEVLWGTFASGFVELDADNSLNLTSLFSRASEDETLNQLGFREDTGFSPQDLTTKNSYNFIGRSVFYNQFQGDHRNLRKSEARFRWNLTGGFGRRTEPDRRQVQQLVDSQSVTTASRFNSDLNQWFLGGVSSVRFPVYEAFETQAYLSFGATAGYQDREFDARRFVQQQQGNNFLIGDPEVLFNADNLGRVTTIREITQIEDSYVASNLLVGGFAQLETAMAPWLNFLGLLRFEAFNQQVRSESPFAIVLDADDIKSTDRTDLDPLPSTTFKFTVNERMFVILGYGMTVIRPAIRELAPFSYVDFIRGWNITGNEDLQRTRVQNAEARYEFYFGGTDLVAFTGFFKWFDKPIEFVISQGLNRTATYRNAENAWLFGGEVELRLGFGRFHEKLNKLFFSGNVALMKSQSTLPQNQLIGGRLQRALFNQSPFVTNLSLRFDDPDSGVVLGLVYNAFGPRIVEAGSSAGDRPNPDVFEQAQHILDFVASWKPTPHVKLGLKWKNIAFARKRYRQGDQDVLLKNRGTTVSIGAEYIY